MNPADLAFIELEVQGVEVKADENLAPGHARVDAGRLLVQGGIDEAFEQIKATVLSVRERRLGGRTS